MMKQRHGLQNLSVKIRKYMTVWRTAAGEQRSIRSTGAQRKNALAHVRQS